MITASAVVSALARSIINGFAQPLKKEHKDFLIRALVPLHKVGNLHTFHSQLEYCVTQFVEKDRTLSVPVIEGLLRLWPVQNSSKQVLLIGEVEEILELAEAEQFTELVVPLFDRISRCITSPHFQVCHGVGARCQVLGDGCTHPPGYASICQRPDCLATRLGETPPGFPPCLRFQSGRCSCGTTSM